jgi:YD repeat-containing protein
MTTETTREIEYVVPGEMAHNGTTEVSLVREDEHRSNDVTQYARDGSGRLVFRTLYASEVTLFRAGRLDAEDPTYSWYLVQEGQPDQLKETPPPLIYIPDSELRGY